MAGHSKWANIQHRKGAQDKKRAKIFSKVSKAIITAVKASGPDPDMNLRLKYAIEQARAVNMPKDNIERAIKSASGSQDGDNYEHLAYEGYGPGGVAILIEGLTDNRNRTAPELRKIFEKNGGNLGATGCVAHLFSRLTYITVLKTITDEESLMEMTLEAGAEDIKDGDDVFEIYGPTEAFGTIRDALKAHEIEIASAQITMIPSLTVEVQDEATATKILRMMDLLDDHDDVQEVYSNFDISDEILEKVASS